MQAANACRYWPSGRGIYHNDAKTFLVWCNEEDHLRIISMQMGGNLGEVFRRLTTAVNDIEKRVPFSHNDRLGFVSFLTQPNVVVIEIRIQVSNSSFE